MCAPASPLCRISPSGGPPQCCDEAVVVGPRVGEVEVEREARRLHGVGRLVSHQGGAAGAVEAEGADERQEQQEAEDGPTGHLQ